jgi:hypothetical protein
MPARSSRLVAVVAIVLLAAVAAAAALTARLPTDSSASRSEPPATTAAATPTVATPTPSAPVSATIAPTASSAATVGTQTTVPTATPPGQFVDRTLGLSMILPEPYRRSSLSRTFQGDKPAAQDAFTARTAADEEALSRDQCETACRIWNYVALVEVFPHEAGTGAPREWYTRFSYAAGERIEEVMVDGRPAVRVDGGATYTVQYVIRDGDRIVRAAYLILPPDLLGPPPVGASRDKLEQILASLRFIS